MVSNYSLRTSLSDYLFYKDIFDRLFALVFLVFLSPLMFFISCLIIVFIGKPVLFRQIRPGRCGSLFQIFKFRSMSNDVDKDGSLLPDAMRLNSFGRLLRSTSLDELPELINILRGEMSFIGPRPLLIDYLSLYSPQQFRRHDVKPGLSGWAQINGRNAISWDERFHFDVWYVQHQSFWLDLRIFLLTIIKVLFRKGISAPGEATMPPFGNITSSSEIR